jgi:hypothetical protein
MPINSFSLPSKPFVRSASRYVLLAITFYIPSMLYGQTSLTIRKEYGPMGLINKTFSYRNEYQQLILDSGINYTKTTLDRYYYDTNNRLNLQTRGVYEYDDASNKYVLKDTVTTELFYSSSGKIVKDHSLWKVFLDDKEFESVLEQTEINYVIDRKKKTIVSSTWQSYCYDENDSLVMRNTYWPGDTNYIRLQYKYQYSGETTIMQYASSEHMGGDLNLGFINQTTICRQGKIIKPDTLIYSITNSQKLLGTYIFLDDMNRILKRITIYGPNDGDTTAYSYNPKGQLIKTESTKSKCLFSYNKQGKIAKTIDYFFNEEDRNKATIYTTEYLYQ